MAAVQELAERVKGSADKIYIDTDAGADDTTADGTEAKPFKSLAYASTTTKSLVPLLVTRRPSPTRFLPLRTSGIRACWTTATWSFVETTLLLS